MLESLYIKLIASAIVLAVIGGGYWYVKHLQNQVTSLNRENITLTTANQQLGDTLKDQKTQNDNMNKILQAGNTVKEENKNIHREQLKKIDEGVRQGKDRPVGPLLKEFLNG